jgi:hypothetical protein
VTFDMKNATFAELQPILTSNTARYGAALHHERI